jgi:multidrug resistance efflux pump
MVLPSATNPTDTGPAEAPRAEAAPPSAPGKRTNWRKWRARFIVLLLLAAAVFAFLRISGSRAQESNRVGLEQVTLTAQAIPIEPSQVGQLTAVSVAAQQTVRAGQRVGTMEVAGTDADGDPKITKVNLTAPRAGIVIDTPASIGSTVGPGVPMLQMYDPAQATFVTAVSLEDLSVIAPTMTANLRADGVNRTVHASVQRIVPRVTGAQATSGTDLNKLQIVLVPASTAEVNGLVPGLRFTGYINTVSGEPGTARLIS